MMENKETTELFKFLTFRLGSETFSVDVSQVREILDQTEVTMVPQTPDYMLGVINLRGSVVPVVDLRQRFGIEAAARTRDSCIIVMELIIEGEQTVIGALTDAVEEVVDISREDIEPPPRLGNQMNVDFIRGVGKRDDQFFMILDIDRIFSCEEVQLINVDEEETVAVAG
jgi:purine-binding chemotaxis protein CheW